MSGKGRLLRRLLVTAAALLFLLAIVGESQQDDEQRRFLEVRRRQLELQAARRQYERTEKLSAQGLLPQSDTDRDRNNVATAQLNYQQAVLALLDLQPRISVQGATKTQSGDGRKFVRLLIANLTPTFDDSQFTLLNNFEGADPIPESLRTRSVNDVFVSLRETRGSLDSSSSAQNSGATISLPYEVHIPQMKYGEKRTLDFQLLRDVDAVIVALTYRTQTREIPVQLQHAAGSNEMQISSSQSSQEADLGSQATFNLTLERPTVDVRSFQLKVVNLPRQISYSFVDPQSQARLSQITFPAGVTRQSLWLRLFLPERADESVRLDRSLEFWALMLDEASAAHFVEERVYSDAEFSGVGSGKIKMVVTPRGVGRIEVTASTLFSQIATGQTVETKITVRNRGTRRLDNITFSAESSLNWRVEFEPNSIAALDINRDEVVTAKFIPPADVGVGDYEIRIKTEATAGERVASSEDKVYRVNVKPRASLLTTALMVGGLLLLVVGIGVVGVRVARR